MAPKRPSAPTAGHRYIRRMAWQYIRIARFGGPEVLELAEQPTIPDPGPGEVRIKVLAAGTGFTDTFIRRGSLAHIVDRLHGNPRVHIMHNADDFLAERKTIEALKETLGDKMTLYPYGGHLGNIWYPENKEYALRYFRPRR